MKKNFTMNKCKYNAFIAVLLFGLSAMLLSAQDALKSTEEDYYDFLALQGLTERPYLNYRTLSESVWNIDEAAEHPWQDLIWDTLIF